MPYPCIIVIALFFKLTSTMEQSDQSYYSNDEQYFLDLCRAGELQELKQLIQKQDEASTFDFACITNSHDNFLHILAANNLTEIFDYLYPAVVKKLGHEGWSILINKQNSTRNTPLHYAVITNSKEMAIRLIKSGANTNLTNDSGRTPFAEAQQFDKIDIAEILAPITNNNLEELRKQTDQLELCNEDSDEDEEELQLKPESQQKQESELKPEVAESKEQPAKKSE